MEVKTELAVIGGGPAGLCAAIEAARRGVEVALVDENQRAGGQLFKQIHRFFGSEEHLAGIRGITIGEMLLEDARKHGVRVLLNTVAWGLFPDRQVGVVSPEGVDTLEARKVVVATGAIENSLSFPGWTLPNVMGAGAAQTMVNVHRVLPGQRVLIVGSGNVGLIVAYQLLQAGAEVVAVVEALPGISGYQVHASKIVRMGVPILCRHTILRALGAECVQKAEIARVDERFQPVPGSERLAGRGPDLHRRGPAAAGRAVPHGRRALRVPPGPRRPRAPARRDHADHARRGCTWPGTCPASRRPPRPWRRGVWPASP